MHHFLPPDFAVRARQKVNTTQGASAWNPSLEWVLYKYAHDFRLWENTSFIGRMLTRTSHELLILLPGGKKVPNFMPGLHFHFGPDEFFNRDNEMGRRLVFLLFVCNSLSPRWFMNEITPGLPYAEKNVKSSTEVVESTFFFLFRSLHRYLSDSKHISLLPHSFITLSVAP